ncbi:uncharacterized protein LOC102610248 isoform X6 [Citrus sinensis]|uniref:uncharacterized protein LOC102610248 isoform X6 n=1 Tax=Citrus sinensis TaxID=2711 RepID=UPI002278FD62|nr:uncharacterized protein LOC102610248 isoform X6 [Citrus sinensis]
MSRPHVLVMPAPAQGHIIPLLEFSQCLANHGIRVTFVITDYDHKRVVESLEGKNDLVEQTHLVSIPDGMEPWEDRNDLGKLIEKVLQVMPGKLEELIEEINSREDEKLDCFIADGYMAWSMEVAKKMNVRGGVFWSSSAASVALVFRIPKLIDDGIIDSHGSWGVHFPLQPDQLKRVEAVLANSCSNRELLTTYNFLESRLILPGHKMEDAVIGALTRKRSRPPATKKDQSKDAPTAKRANIVQQVSPLKTLPPPPAKAGETSGATTDPASSFPPVGPQSRLTDNRAEHLAPYLNELSKLVSKKDLEEFDGCTLGELVGAMQYSAFHLSCMTTYYKAKVGRYDRKMKEDIQSATTRANVAEKKAGELNVENLKLIEQESLAQAKAITLEEELNKVREDLRRQKAMYDAQLESLRNSHQAQVENLEREADNQYDQGLRHSYRCIMAVLGKQHPDLKMDDLAAGVAQHMDEEAAKEDAEGTEPIMIEEENSPPRVVPADVGEARTPPPRRNW